MQSVVMVRFFCVLNLFLLPTALFADTVWEIPEREVDILIDGFLDEWEGVPAMVLEPGGSDVQSAGEFGQDDLRAEIRALWDKEYLYVALDWQDNVWDIQDVSRREAVWVDSNGRRRDRMHFFDNIKFHIRKSDYDYTMWLSPRVADAGPFSWCRLLQGYGGMERATSAPTITARDHGNRATIEVVLLWKQLRIKPKKNQNVPLRLVIADSDLPGKMLDSKVQFLKWLGWKGQFRIVETKDQ